MGQPFWIGRLPAAQVGYGTTPKAALHLEGFIKGVEVLPGFIQGRFQPILTDAYFNHL
jgi:hypothetical protein